MPAGNRDTRLLDEAFEMLREADRLHRQFLTLALGRRARAGSRRSTSSRTRTRCVVRVALPGVAPTTSRSAPTARDCPSSGVPVAGRRGTTIHRLEIPYGRFERTIELPARPLRPRQREVVDGLPRSSSCADSHDYRLPRHAAHRGWRTAAALRRADRRSRAQLRAVSGARSRRSRSAAASPCSPRRKRCARKSRSASSCSATAETEQPARRTCTRSAPRRRSCATSRRRTARTTSWCRASSASASSSSSRAAPSRRRASSSLPDPVADEPRHRGAHAAGEGARRRAARADAARAGRDRGLGRADPARPARSPTSSPA